MRFVEHDTSIGFVQSRADSSLFVLRQGLDMAYLLLYVDDMILSASSTALLQHIVARLKSRHQGHGTGELLSWC